MKDYNRNELDLMREEVMHFPLGIKESLFGDRQFYHRVFALVLPMVIQNTLTNVVTLLDNIMVGRVGTIPMSAVAIVGQLIFVFYVCIFGLLAGAGIYGTQFFGKGDEEGVRNTFRFKLVASLLLCTIVILVLFFAGDFLVSLYISADTPAADAKATLDLARDYLRIMLLGIVPYGITQCVAGTMREGGRSVLPMIASIAAVLTNFVLNLLLIFGLLGFPKLGVVGAAVATVISRLLELLILFIGYRKGRDHYRYFKGVLRHFRIPKSLIPKLMKKAMPLLTNECLWSVSQALLLQAYSVRGIGAIAALNIAFTVANIFNEVFLSLGSSAGILIGQELGANHLLNAKRTSWRMSFLSMIACLISGALLFFIAPLIPEIYNTEPEIRALAVSCIRVLSVFMPINALTNVFYFTLRSGGKMLVTFLFDFCFAWLGSLPVAFSLTNLTTLPVETCFLLVYTVEILKAIVGFFLVKRGRWINNLVSDTVA